MNFDLVYVCDAMPGIGMGHLSRGLEVLAELIRYAPGLHLGLAGTYSGTAWEFLERRIPEGVVLAEEGDPGWSARVVVLDTMAEPGNPAALDGARAASLRRRCGELVLVSSAVEVETVPEIGVLIDHMPRVRILGPRPGRCHVGLEFAPVGAEFFEVEPEPPGECSSLVAVIGGSERQIGPTVVAELFAEGPGSSFESMEMVVSTHYPPEDLEGLRRRHPNWTVHRNIDTLVPLLARAAAVICTYGNITWESLALGRPTFVLGYAAFQVRYADLLDAMGLVVSCGPFDAPRLGKLKQVLSPELRRDLAVAAQGAGIECGARNIAQVLREEVDRVQDR